LHSVGYFFQETEVLQELISELLKNGEISEACRVTSMFTVYSQDLAIVLVRTICYPLNTLT